MSTSYTQYYTTKSFCTQLVIFLLTNYANRININKKVRNAYNGEGGVSMLSTNYLMTAEEVAEKLDCSTGHAYKLIRSMNQELKKQGFYVIAGKIPRAFVEQKFFGMTLQAQ